jgi:hypothetical protein
LHRKVTMRGLDFARTNDDNLAEMA